MIVNQYILRTVLQAARRVRSSFFEDVNCIGRSRVQIAEQARRLSIARDSARAGHVPMPLYRHSNERTRTHSRSIIVGNEPNRDTLALQNIAE